MLVANRFLSLEAWLDYLITLHPQAVELGLERIKQVALRLALLPFSCPVITVTGTNGKGSCVALLEAILLAQGYRVGAYTSPHLFAYNERVRVNGVIAEDTALCVAFAEIEQARQATTLTYFEFGTLAALLVFKQADLDVVILEVGMGGRLDAVNIVDAEVAIISTIALDHREWLGNTREEIGWEKAGIMRAGKAVVCGDFAVPASVHHYAKQIGAFLYCQGDDFNYEKTGPATWLWSSAKQSLVELPIPRIELQNAAAVLKAAELLPATLKVTPAAIAQGLRHVYLPGRFQIMAGTVTRIFDVAHNPAAAVWLATQLQATPCNGPTLAVLAMLTDKDREGTVAPLLAIVDAWYVADLQILRGGSAQQLVECLHEAGITEVSAYDTVTQAYRAALLQAPSGSRVVVFGSFYTVAEAMQLTL